MKFFKHNIITVLLLPLLVASLVFITVSSVSAQTGAPNTGSLTGAPNTGTKTTSSDQSATQGAALNIHLANPLSGVSTIPDAINKFLGIIIRVALPLIILFFIWSGLSFIFARGNPEKVKTAKNMFFYTVIGTLLILGAWVITNAIIGTVNAIIG